MQTTFGREHEGQPMRLAAAHQRCPKRCVRNEKRNARATDQSRPSKNARTQSAMQLPKPTTLESFSAGLTPELSRAAKRRRLERIVRADVTVEAAEPQAVTPRTKREPLTERRATRRPRLGEPKPERRPTEATNTGWRMRKGKHRAAGGDPSANPKINSHAWRRRTCAIRSDASEARTAVHERLTNGDPAKHKKPRTQ